MKLSRRPDRKVIMQDGVDKQNRDAENSGSNNNYINPFKFPDDVKPEWLSVKPEQEYEVDIIPFEVTSKNHPDFKDLIVYDNNYREDYAMTYHVHKKIGPGGNATVPCLKENKGLPCPVCEERERLLKEKVYEWDADELAPFKYKSRTIFNVLDKEDGKIKLFDYPTAWFKKNLLNKSKRVRGADSQVCLSDISDDGYRISFFAETSTFKTKKGDPVPGEIKDIEFIKREKGEGYPDSIIDEAYKVDTFFNLLSYEEIEAIMLGEEPESTNEETTKVSEPKKEESGLSEREKRLQEREEKLKAKSTDENENVCPNGLTFGVDNLSDDVCDNCPKDPECAAEFERLQN